MPASNCVTASDCGAPLCGAAAACVNGFSDSSQMIGISARRSRRMSDGLVLAQHQDREVVDEPHFSRMAIHRCEDGAAKRFGVVRGGRGDSARQVTLVEFL